LIPILPMTKFWGLLLRNVLKKPSHAAQGWFRIWVIPHFSAISKLQEKAFTKNPKSYSASNQSKEPKQFNFRNSWKLTPQHIWPPRWRSSRGSIDLKFKTCFPGTRTKLMQKTVCQYELLFTRYCKVKNKF
jgi:hypothetical protein